MNNTTIIKASERNSAIDIIRIIAVLSVLMIHVSSFFLENFSDDSTQFIVSNIFSVMSRLGVPLFVMISGALLLNENKELSTKKLFKKNILNIIFLIFVWSLVYAITYQIIFPLVAGESLSINEFLKALIFGHYHIWYLYMIIGLYLITPILRCFVKVENAKIVLYYIFLALIFKFTIPLLTIVSNEITIFQNIIDYINKFYTDFLGGYLTYYLIGWYIVNVGFTKKAYVVTYVTGLISLSAIILINQFLHQYQDLSFSNITLFNFFYSIAVFSFILNYYKPKERSNNLIRKLSSLAFGVYIVHILVLSFADLIMQYSDLFIVLFIILKWLLVTIVSFVVTFLISLIPKVKKIVRG